MIDGSVGNVLDYGASPSATGAQNSAAFQAALDANKTVFVPEGNYDISVSLNLNGGNILCGVGVNSKLNYTGADQAILLNSTYHGVIKELWINTTESAATGVKLTGQCQYNKLVRLHITGGGAFSNTGCGVFIEGNPGWTGYTGILSCQIFYYKYGIYITNDVTSVNCFDVGILGYPVAPYISGGRGYITAPGSIMTPSNSGSTFYGGYLDLHQVAVEIAENSSVKMDSMQEGANPPYIIGEGFNGRINFAEFNAGGFIEQNSTPDGSTIYYKEKESGGSYILESYEPQSFSFYYQSGVPYNWGLYGTSDGKGLISNTGFPVFRGPLMTQGSMVTHDLDRERLACGNFSISWNNGFPTTGNWQLGSIIFNFTATSGSPMGWICSSPGSFGAALSTTGTIASGSFTLTVANSTGFVVGDYLDIGTASYSIIRKIVGNVISVTFGLQNLGAPSTQTNVTVSRRTPPIFIPLANVP
jgi:hypothetical protein